MMRSSLNAAEFSTRFLRIAKKLTQENQHEHDPKICRKLCCCRSRKCSFIHQCKCRFLEICAVKQCSVVKRYRISCRRPAKFARDASCTVKRYAIQVDEISTLLCSMRFVAYAKQSGSYHVVLFCWFAGLNQGTGRCPVFLRIGFPNLHCISESSQ